MQIGNLMLAIGFAALVLGTGKDDSSKDEAAHVGHDSSMKAATTTKGESKNVWYYEGQVKDQARTEDVRTTAADHEYKVTKTKGHSDSHTTHADSAPSKETGYKNKDHDKDDSHGHKDSSSSKGSYYDSMQHKESSSYDESYGSDHYEGSGSSEGSYGDSHDYYNSEHKSTVSIGPEETMLKGSSHTSTVSVGPEETNLMEPSYNDHKSTVSIGPEETSLPESTTSVEVMMEHHTMTLEYYSDKTTTKTTTRTIFSTHMIEATATTTAKIYTQGAPPQVTVDTSAASPIAFTTPPYSATYVANVPSTLATTVPGVFATASFVPNATVSAPPQFTGGSERLGANSVVAIAAALVALGWVVM